MLFDDRQLHELFTWMDINVLVLDKVYNDGEIIRVRNSQQFFRARSEDQAKEFVVICHYHRFLIRKGYL